MQVQRKKQHLMLAKELYQKRNDLLREKYLLRDEQATYDYRLQIHLYILEQENISITKEPESASDVFLTLVCYLNASETTVKRQGYELASKWLENENFQEAVCDALILYPPADGGEFLLNTYYVCPHLRSTLLNLWLAIQQSVPQHILKDAFIAEDKDLQQTAIKCAAWIDSYGLDDFNRLDLSNDVNCQLAVLFARILRQDEGIISSIKDLASQELAEERYEYLMYLTAVAGAKELLPLLQDYAHKVPKKGLYFLALSGYKECIPLLLAALQNIETTNDAAAAWFFLTGQTLAKKPRLQVVQQDVITQKSKQTVPDADVALSWWETHGKQWQQQRYSFGKSINKINLQSILTEYAGSWMQNIYILQSCLQKNFKYRSEKTWLL